MLIPTVKNSRRYFRLVIFSGVFASAIFTGTKVFANQLMTYTEFYNSISADISSNVSGTHHDLGADIDVPEAIGATVFSGTFKGILNGFDFTIIGLTKPLFDHIGATAAVNNLNLGNLEDPVEVIGNGALSNTVDAGGAVNNVDVTGDVTGDTKVGGLVGNSSGTITNSTVVGDVTGTGDYVGGLVGSSVGTISNSSVVGNVTGTGDYVGGLVGNSVGDISDSSASGAVEGNNYVGGLVGKSVGDIRNSSATGDSDFPEAEPEREGDFPEFVTGSDSVGGLVGYSEGDVINSNAAIGVVGHDGGNVGGLVGYSKGDITDSSASGVVISIGMGGPGDYIGGLVGYSEGVVANSDASGDVEGGSYVGGLVGKSVGNISDSHATGDVKSLIIFEFDYAHDRFDGDYGVRNSGEYLGGLVGHTTGDIAGSYATGDVRSTVEGSIANAPNQFNIELNSGSNLGGLVGHSAGVITDSYAEGIVSSRATLSILSIEDSVTDEVTADINLYSGENLGGLAGYSAGGVTGSHALRNVTSTITLTIDDDIIDRINGWENYGEDNDADRIGGLVGLSDGNIANSYARGDVTGEWNLGGLVGYTTGDVTNSFATGDVTGDANLGGLIGNSRGNIRDSHATGDVISMESRSFDGDPGNEGNYDRYDSGSHLGGLVGYTTGDITNSYAEGDVSSTLEVSIANAPIVFSIEVYSGENLGGLVGYSDGMITDSHAEGDVISIAILNILSIEDPDAEVSANIEIESGEQLGGLAGYSAEGVTGSHALGDVIATTTLTFGDNLTNEIIFGEYYEENNFGDRLGGLVGESDGNITNSYATGNVTGDWRLGGLVGDLDWDLIITNSYATGNVTGDDNLGGLVGEAFDNSRISNSYATGNVTGDDDLGGLVGELKDDAIIIDSYATGDVTGADNLGGLVGQFGYGARILYSYANGNVTGDDRLGGLVGEAGEYSIISKSYAKGNVTGDDDLGGLVGELYEYATVRVSYATGNVASSGSDAGGLVGDAYGAITYSHASGDVSGFADVGGLVGDLQNAGSITHSYATGDIKATGSGDGDWSNGWGGLVGESSGQISNSYATGNVVADYNYGALIGFAMLNEEPELQAINSFATGPTSSANNTVRLFEYVYDEDWNLLKEIPLELNGFGGLVGCAVWGGFESYSCIDFDEILPIVTPSILSVINTVASDEEPAFEIVACKNNGLPLLSALIHSYANTCPVSPNRTIFAQASEGARQQARIRITSALNNGLTPTQNDLLAVGFSGISESNVAKLAILILNEKLTTLEEITKAAKKVVLLEKFTSQLNSFSRISTRELAEIGVPGMDGPFKLRILLKILKEPIQARATLEAVQGLAEKFLKEFIARNERLERVLRKQS